MSLSRAFTLRSKRTEALMSPTTLPSRAGSLRSSDKPVDIRKISGPVALLSTTNMLSYNAPDVSEIRAQRKASNSVSSSSSSSSSSSRSLAEDSDSHSSAESHVSNDTSLTDISEPSSPSAATSNGLFHSFSTKRSLRRSASSSAISQKSSISATSLSPEVPQRAPSHSKKAHEKLARKRSMQLSRQNSMQSISEHVTPLTREHRNSFDFFRADLDDPKAGTPKEEVEAPMLPAITQHAPLTQAPIHHHTPRHPFGKELAQLAEVAEEFGTITRNAEQENDVTIMSQKGLRQFCADDYMREIRPLFSRIFVPRQAAAWI